MRFTTRELMLLTAIVALALGWSISTARFNERLRLRARHAEALRHALQNAEDYRDAYLSQEHPSTAIFAPVDWELTTREIP